MIQPLPPYKIRLLKSRRLVVYHHLVSALFYYLDSLRKKSFVFPIILIQSQAHSNNVITVAVVDTLVSITIVVHSLTIESGHQVLLTTGF